MGNSFQWSYFPYSPLKQWREGKMFKLDRSHSTSMLMPPDARAVENFGNVTFHTGIATAFIGSRRLKKVPPPLFRCIWLSAGASFQKSSRAKVLKVQDLEEKDCFQD